MHLAKKFLCSLCLLWLFLVCSYSKTYSINDPLSVPNNRFGIHIINTADLDDAAKLVNSGGGDWGYVTLVITKNDKDTQKWQQVFDKMRSLHLIPIIRIATGADGANWEKPALGEIDSWVSFLNSLNWVIENRYIVIGNEVNSAKEWGGEVNPEEYATYLKTFSQKLKSVSPDFFVVPSAFDASLTSTYNSFDEIVFIRRVLSKEPDFFNFVDGWASHSYPNPAFSGSPYAQGRGTIQTYAWELDLLRNFGLNKSLPVFILETGWDQTKKKNLDKNYTYAFTNVWSDKRIVAVTPFILNYDLAPYKNFSWKIDGNFTDLYFTVQDLPKIKGAPVQKEIGQISRIVSPVISFSRSSFNALLFVLNEGQTIWNVKDLSVADLQKNIIEITKTTFTTLLPGESGLIFVKGKTPLLGGNYKESLYLLKCKKIITPPKEFEMYLLGNLTWPPLLWHPD